MPVPVIVGGIAAASTPGVRKGVGKLACKVKKCNYVLEEVEFHDTVSGNTTFSDVNIHFPVPQTVNRFSAQTGVCGIPSVRFEECTKELKSVVIETSVPAPGAARFQGVPPTCMELAKAMVGQCGVSSQLAPVACGEKCLQYSDLTVEQLGQLTSVLTTS